MNICTFHAIIFTKTNIRDGLKNMYNNYDATIYHLITSEDWKFVNSISNVESCTLVFFSLKTINNLWTKYRYFLITGEIFMRLEINFHLLNVLKCKRYTKKKIQPFSFFGLFIYFYLVTCVRCIIFLPAYTILY